MKIRIGLFVVAAALAFAVAAPAPAAFADNTAKVTTTKKKIVVHRKRHVAKRRGPAYPELEPYRSFGFIGKFPGSCAYDRAAGRCMIDLGYGRCVPCNVGDGGGRF
jgi:hypothetical protein